MPIGVITNVVAVIIGGLIGTAVGPRISERFKNGLNTIFGICASGTGIYGSIVSGMTVDHSILLAKSILDLCLEIGLTFQEYRIIFLVL